MKSEKKTFDCVAMKHEGAERVQALLAKMTHEEQIAYWREQGRELEEMRQQMIARKMAS